MKVTLAICISQERLIYDLGVSINIEAPGRHDDGEEEDVLDPGEADE